MRIFLKNINERKLLKCSRFGKNLTLQALQILKKLNVDVTSFSVYNGRSKISWFSSTEDAKKEKEEFLKCTTLDEQEDFLIKWYFKKRINNECSKILYLRGV